MKRLRANLSQGLNAFLSNHRVTLLLSYEEFDLIHTSLESQGVWFFVKVEPLIKIPTRPGYRGVTFYFLRSSDAVMFKLTWG